MNTVTDVAAHIKQIWSSSAFMNLLKSALPTTLSSLP